jgi:hypothetical protein
MVSEKNRSGFDHPFPVIEMHENDISDSKEDLIREITHKLLLHLEDLDSLKASYSYEPPHLLEEHIQNHVIATDSHQIGLITRQGDWAEILSAEILEKMRNYILPIYKLRWKDSKDQAMRGKADVIVCQVSPEFTIVFTEVKSKIRYTPPSRVKELCKGVCKSLSTIQEAENPEIVNYVWDKLRFVNDGEADYDLLSLFDKAKKYPNTYSKDYQVFYVFQTEHWRDEFLEIIDLLKPKLPKLTVNIVFIDSLEDWIRETYSLVPEIAKEIVYE